MTIAGVLPTLTVPLTASVAALSAKENMFSGKVTSADSAYQNADESGGQSVGQLGQMLGQLGQLSQMAQQAGQPAQALGGTFSQMIQQAMGKGGGDSQGGGSSAGAQPSAGQGPSGAGGAPQQARNDASATGQEKDQAQAKDRDERDGNGWHDRPRLDAAEPSAAPSGPAPVAPPEPARHPDGEDLSRRM